MSRKYVIASIVGSAALLALIVLVLLGVGRSTSPAPAPSSPTSTAAEAATMRLAPTTEGAVEATEIPWSQFSAKVASAPVVGDAFVNEGTGVAAAWMGGRLYSASLTSAMVPEAVSELSAKSSSVTVVPASGRAAIPGSRYGTPSATSTGGSGWVVWIVLGAVFAGVAAFLIGARRRARAEARKEAAKPTPTPDTRFADVAGCDEAIEDMVEVVEFLKDPTPYARVGASVPKGALLCGPPGTGKTLLARAVAGEAGVPFMAASGSDFVEMYVGVGAKRIRELFAKARKEAKERGGCIVFIDEIDSVGRKRSSASANTSNTEQEGTLNALLVELDGFSKDANIIVLGATNREDLLDDALLRPGRLSRKIHVGLPDRVAREKILAVHARKRPLAADADLVLVAKRTPGMSGAELEAIINEASMIVARAKRDEITNMDLDEAVATVAMGKARLSAVVSDEDRRITAWHEAGHAVVALALPDSQPPVSVSILPRGRAGGVTWFPESDAAYMRRKEAFARMCVGMGGRAAEEMFFGDGEFTTGPMGDLQMVTNLALNMVTQYGMTDHGLIVKSGELLGTGAALTDEVVAKAEELAASSLDIARGVLRENADLMERFVDALLEWDTLTADQIAALVKGARLSAPEIPAPPREYSKPKPAGTAPVRVFTPETPRRRKGLAGRLVGALGAALMDASEGRRRAR